MVESGTKVTESVSTVTFDEERRESLVFRKIIDLWPLWLTLAGGVVASIKFYYTLTDVVRAQQNWQSNSESRREHLRDVQEADHIKAAVQANDLEWIKELRRENASRDHVKP